MWSSLLGLSQIVGGNGYLITPYVEVAVDGNGGHEGTIDWPGHHSRGGTDEVFFGFVADPNATGWEEYNGDYFTAGVPENGFGLEINGTNYSNNAWDAGDLDYYFQEIPKAPGTSLEYLEEGRCKILRWTGKVGGVTITQEFRIRDFDKYYTTRVTLYNGSGTNLNDLYYYRNIDPDNNESIGGTFNTTNEIESQASPSCIKALVSASQGSPHPSYIGLGALGEKFRVSHGGFSNRDASNIWNATGGLNGTVGSVASGDESISLAYKTDLAAGATETFEYVIVLNEADVEDALSSLYWIEYDAIGGSGGGGTDDYCNPELIQVSSCLGDTVCLTINGPFTEGYEWTWIPSGLTGETVCIPISDIGMEGIFTVTGSPEMPCLTSNIVKDFLIEFDNGPQLGISYPDDTTLICGEFNMDDIIYANLGDAATNCIYLTVQPDSANQTEIAYEEPTMGMDDVVYLMCGDSATGCFDWVKLNFNFLGENSAGDDTLVYLCGGPGFTFDLSSLRDDSTNAFGWYYNVTGEGSLDSASGLWNGSGLYGTFEFYYITQGRDTCLADTALYTLVIEPSPFAGFEYYLNGDSTITSVATCLGAELQLISNMSIPEPAEIASWTWYFGDGESSTLLNPTHIYEDVGIYVITLVVVSETGCIGTYARTITIYDQPELEMVYTFPNCFGYNDGTISVEDEYLGNPLDIFIYDEDENLLNEAGEDSLGDLPPGTYTVFIEDPGGCTDSASVTLLDPHPLEMYLTIYNPACNGDSGFVKIDSIFGENPNNPVSYFWEPNPAGIEGVFADSSYNMPAGDYMVTALDTRGCTDTVHFTLIDPPPFYFTEWGSDTAYCRLYNYQSGNGYVYAAAAGGVPNYNYEWTYLHDGTTSNNTTWGGRNPGDHLITVTDAYGCVLTKIVHVDSVNPVADFNVISSDLQPSVLYGDLSGTAPVAVEFVNQSEYYANPNNPDADTLFFWDMDRTEEDDWIISYDYYETVDTVYEARGHAYDVDVCLIAFNKNGCRDTTCKTITLWEPPEINPVNIFSPNGDGKNDVLTFVNYQKGISHFECIIVDRWGVQVGEINEIYGSWDGYNYSGRKCPDGVYFYSYTARGNNNETFSGQGTVQIIDSGVEAE
jgi:gliding motility-associated-like protein